MIPADKEETAIKMFRAVAGNTSDVEMMRIHRAIWPAGCASVSVSTLRTLLSAMSAAEEVADPPDDLPEGLQQAITDLESARVKIMDKLNAGLADGEGDGKSAPGEAGLSDVGYHAALSRNVATHIAAVRLQIELQAHRAVLLANRKARGGRSGTT